jgi:2Fe-2S ferredoxin
MPNVEFVLPGGERRVVSADEGSTVMQTALSNLISGIVGECGGELSCATCHVFLDETWMPIVGGRGPEETDMLEVTAVEPTEFSRLSCQIRCTAETDGIVVHIPEKQ